MTRGKRMGRRQPDMNGLGQVTECGLAAVVRGEWVGPRPR